MAIQKTVELADGSSVKYHTIGGIHINRIGGEIILEFSSFRDGNTRKAGKVPVAIGALAEGRFATGMGLSAESYARVKPHVDALVEALYGEVETTTPTEEEIKEGAKVPNFAGGTKI